MSELIFVVEETPEGGFVARALGEAIFTEADDLEGLREKIRAPVAALERAKRAHSRLIRKSR